MKNRRMLVCPPKQAQWAGVWPLSSRVDNTPTPSCSTIVWTGMSMLNIEEKKEYNIVINQWKDIHTTEQYDVILLHLYGSKEISHCAITVLGSVHISTNLLHNLRII